MGNWRAQVKEPLECWIGLCEDMLYCPNQHTCELWAQAWPLPYYYDPDTKRLLIFLSHALAEIRALGFEDITPDLLKEWNELGFADARPLQYERRPRELVVKWDVSGFQQADPLPYKYIIQKSGFRCLIVHPYIIEDAKKAGWAPAVQMCNVDVDDLPW